MAFNFVSYPTGVTATSPAAKGLQVKAIKLSYTDFTTAGANSIKAVLPADASIVGFRIWVKTALSGGSIAGATLSVGITGTATKFVNAVSFGYNTAGTHTYVSPVSNVYQEADPDNRTDISLLVTGTSTTGNPTAGEVYILVEYVR